MCCISEAHNVISGILIYQALLHIFYSISQNTIIELQEKASCKTFDFRVWKQESSESVSEGKTNTLIQAGICSGISDASAPFVI